MEQVDSEVEEENIQKVLTLLGIKSIRSDSPQRIKKEELKQAAGVDISNELLHLRDVGAIELGQTFSYEFVVLSDEKHNEVKEYGASMMILGSVERPKWMDDDWIDEHAMPEIDEEDQPYWSWNIDEPELYVAALKPFGDALMENPEVKYSDAHIRRHCGKDLDEQLEDLVKWDYLEPFSPTELGFERSGEVFYQLNLDDKDVQGDAAASSIYIEKKYGGRVDLFLNEYSEEDEEALREKGVNFFQEV